MNGSQKLVVKKQKSIENISPIERPTKPIYKKPETTCFLEKAAMIQGGVDFVLESQGLGYLTS